MNVTRIHDAGGSHIEPELDPDWDDHTKLQWHTAVVAHDAGLAIELHDHDGQYSFTIGANLAVGQSSIGGWTFRPAWDFLIGVRIGAQHARKQGERP